VLTKKGVHDAMEWRRINDHSLLYLPGKKPSGYQKRFNIIV